MPPRQTSLLNHFTRPNQRNATAGPGPSSRQTRNAAPATRPRRRERERSESEGPEAMDAIGMGPSEGVDVGKLPMTQRRAMNKVVYGSDDEVEQEDVEEEDDEEHEEEAKPERAMKTVRRAKGRRLRRGQVDDTELDEAGPSIPLDFYDSPDLTPSDYHEKRNAKIAGRKDDKVELEKVRIQQRKDDKLDEEIEVFPSPPSSLAKRSQRPARSTGKPEQVRKAGRSGSVIVVEDGVEDASQRDSRKGKGKGRAKPIEEEEDDDIQPIDPPITWTTSRRNINRPTAASQALNTNHGPKSRGLKFRRTTSELEIRLPTLSQRQRSGYIKWKPSTSSESIIETAPAAESQLADVSKVPAAGPVETVRDASPRDQSEPAKPEDDPSTEAHLQPADRLETSAQAHGEANARLPSLPAPHGPESVASSTDVSKDPALDMATSLSPRPPSVQPDSPEATSLAQPPAPSPPPQAMAHSPPRSQDDEVQIIVDGPMASTVPELSPAKASPKVTSASPHAQLVDGKKATSPVPTKPPASARKRVLPSPTPSSSSSIAIVATRRKDRGKQKVDPDSESESGSPTPTKKVKVRPGPISTKTSRHQLGHKGKGGGLTKTPTKKGHTVEKKGKPGKLKSKALDPDDDDDAMTENEEDMVEQLKMDEPERYKTKTRLREKKKESEFQRKIRRLKARREGRQLSSSESEEDDTSDSASDSVISVDEEEEDFIVADDSTMEVVQLPHMFSIDSAQTPEFKFKVVFHYLVLLAVKRRKAFPLSSEASGYFKPQLHYWRDRMLGFRNFRVRSQIWRSNFVKALEKYPVFEVEELAFAEPGCDACHMGGRMSRFRVTLDGAEYDKETHEPLETSDEESESEDSDDSEAKANKLPRSLLMGRFCRARAEVFHQLVHWEDELYSRIKGYYNDLLRAKYKRVGSDSERSSSPDDPDSDPDEVRERRERRKQRRIITEARVAKLRKKILPDDVKDVDKITEWMDRMGYQTRDFRWIQQMEERSDQLEHDKRRDE